MSARTREKVALEPGEELRDDMTGERYRVLDVIGEGGMGRVLKAENIRTRELYAVKCNRPVDVNDAALLERLRREGRFLKALGKAPNVVPVIATGMRRDGLPWILMPLLDGASVGSLLAVLPRIPLVWALKIGRDVCNGLAVAHKRDAIHRDVKPDNVFLTRAGDVYLLDFGAAKYYGPGRLTTTGTALGTIHFMSPEQLHDPDHVDARTDLFSLAVMLFLMLAGKHPFAGEGPLAEHPMVIGQRILKEPPRPLADHAPGLPGYVSEILDKNLSKTPSERNRSAVELGDILGRAYAELRSRIGGDFLPLERLFDGYDELLRQRDLATASTDAVPNAASPSPTAPPSAVTPTPSPVVASPSASPTPSRPITSPPAASPPGAPVAVERTRSGTVRMGPSPQPAVERTRNGTVRMGVPAHRAPVQPVVERTRNGTVRMGPPPARQAPTAPLPQPPAARSIAHDATVPAGPRTTAPLGAAPPAAPTARARTERMAPDPTQKLRVTARDEEPQDEAEEKDDLAEQESWDVVRREREEREHERVGWQLHLVEQCGERDTPEARAHLLLALRTDDSPVVRAAAAAALGRIGDEKCLEDLDVRAAYDADPMVRCVAEDARNALHAWLRPVDPAPKEAAPAARPAKRRSRVPTRKTVAYGVAIGAALGLTLVTLLHIFVRPHDRAPSPPLVVTPAPRR